MKEPEDMTVEEALQEWETGEPVELGPPPARKSTMSVYHLRIDDDTLDSLATLALLGDEPPSAIARRILKSGIREELSRSRRLSGDKDAVVLDALDRLKKFVETPVVKTVNAWVTPAGASPNFIMEFTKSQIPVDRKEVK
ncbi:MAG: hypothetical protein KKF66_06220 [Actinobacteria bacterium]|nr:hypothetical protein [Actinomycetota bacterium]